MLGAGITACAGGAAVSMRTVRAPIDAERQDRQNSDSNPGGSDCNALAKLPRAETAFDDLRHLLVSWSIISKQAVQRSFHHCRSALRNPISFANGALLQQNRHDSDGINPEIAISG
jgi:hypothetical protein